MSKKLKWKLNMLTGDIGNTKKNKVNFPEVKIIMPENRPARINSRLYTREEKNGEFEDRAIETI